MITKLFQNYLEVSFKKVMKSDWFYMLLHMEDSKAQLNRRKAEIQGIELYVIRHKGNFLDRKQSN